MHWNYSMKSKPNICLKSCIQTDFKLVTPLTPLQWVDRGRDQRYRGEQNQSSIHLTGEIRWFVLALWEKPANMHLKILARHLHPTTYPSDRAEVIAGSSTQPGESVQLLTPRIALNHYGQKQRSTHHCHTRMHWMQNSGLYWKTQTWSLSLYNN